MLTTRHHDRRRILLAVSSLAVLLILNAMVWHKERVRQEGQLVYLELAPVDPRSLMQGDYMTLRYELADQAHHAIHDQHIEAGELSLVVSLDDRRVARFHHLGAEAQGHDQIVLQGSVGRHGQLSLGGADSFFFQEGHAQRYEEARFARARVGADGVVMVVELCDAQLRGLGPEEE